MHLSRKIFLYTFLIIVIAAIISKSYPQQIKFRHLNLDNGLSHSVVNCMIQDQTGFMWFGTEDGLDRYDGYDFKVFRNIAEDTNSISDNNIWSLFEDSDGKIWTGTQNGILNCFNPETERFEHYNLDANNPVSGNSITCIYQDKNKIFWIGTYKGGLYRFDLKTGSISNWSADSKDRFSLSNKFVTSVYEDEQLRIWIGTYNGLCLLDRGKKDFHFRCFFHDPANNNSLSDNIVWKIFPSPDDSDRIWVGTYNGLTYIDTKTMQFTQFIPDKDNTDQFSRSISSVCEDYSGKDKLMWVGTYDGLVKLKLEDVLKVVAPEKNDKNSGFNSDILKINRYVNKADDPFSILNNHINNILLDRSGVLWIAGQDGVDYYPEQKDKFNFNALNNYEGVNFDIGGMTNVQTVCETKNQTMWIGTSSGIFKLASSKGKYNLLEYPEFSDQNIWSLSPGNANDLWIGTYGNGLEHLDLISHKIENWKGNWYDTSDVANSYVRAVYQDKAGNVWIGLWGAGLNQLNSKTGHIKRWRHENNNPKSLSYDDVWVIYSDSRNRIWIGTYGGGLNLFNSANGDSFYKWSSKRVEGGGLSSDNILSICESHFKAAGNKTILWIGTTDGLNKIEINNNSVINTKPEVKITNYISRENFRARTINSIEEDTRGHLWLGTNTGLVEFDPVSGKSDSYTIFDGLKSNEFNQNAALKSTSGEIFIGSINGLNIFKPENISHSYFKPPVLFTDFQIFNNDVPVNDDSPLKSSINRAKQIILSYNQNVFSFQFASLDYNASEMNQYAYMMEAFDKEWIYSGSRRFVTYTNLFPGKYILKVKATNSDGIWNDTPATVSIIITPPFWSTWWFRGIFFLFIIAILYLVYRMRLNRMLELERLRVKIASDLHDDIGSTLTRISLESELLNSNLDSEGSRAGLNRIGVMSREIISSMSDVVWSIDSRNDSIENLIDRMKDFSFSIFSLKNVRVVFETENLNLQKKLKVDIRQNIYLIFKEAINNSAKYSNSDQVTVSLKNSNSKFIMTIIDPGTVFSSQKLTGHGLKNMEMRAARIGGLIEFINEKGLNIIFTRAEL